MESLYYPVISITILIFSAILHEIMHGYVAYRLGDSTAKKLGRLTLNPLPHIDLYMTILLPAILWISSGGSFFLGGAKPVPVDPRNFKDLRKDLALTSLAGPLTNIVLAVIAAGLIHMFFPNPSFFEVINSSIVGMILGSIVQINIFLAIFNLLPIPPLDGSKLFALLLPESIANKYLSIGEIGTLLLIFLLMFPIGPFSLGDILSRLFVMSLTRLGF